MKVSAAETQLEDLVRGPEFRSVIVIAENGR